MYLFFDRDYSLAVLGITLMTLVMTGQKFENCWNCSKMAFKWKLYWQWVAYMKLQPEIATWNCNLKLQPEIAIWNCNLKLQPEIVTWLQPVITTWNCNLVWLRFSEYNCLEYIFDRDYSLAVQGITFWARMI